MKIYALVCVNENCDVVSVSAHPNIKSARAQLTKEYNLEKQSAENAGYEEAYYDGLEENTAQVSCGDCFYRWEIKETEMAESKAELNENL